jgi:hypothetical protein
MPTFAHLRRSFRSGGLLTQPVRCHGSRACGTGESSVARAKDHQWDPVSKRRSIFELRLHGPFAAGRSTAAEPGQRVGE